MYPPHDWKSLWLILYVMRAIVHDDHGAGFVMYPSCTPVVCSWCTWWCPWGVPGTSSTLECDSVPSVPGTHGPCSVPGTSNALERKSAIHPAHHPARSVPGTSSTLECDSVPGTHGPHDAPGTRSPNSPASGPASIRWYICIEKPKQETGGLTCFTRTSRDCGFRNSDSA